MTLRIRGGAVEITITLAARTCLSTARRFRIGRRDRCSRRRENLDAGGCYVMPGGIDPHTNSSLRHGQAFSGDFEGGPRQRSPAAHHGVDLHSRPGQSMRRRIRMRRKSAKRKGGERLWLPHGGDVVGKQGFDEKWRSSSKTYGINTFQALHGLQGRADGE